MTKSLIKYADTKWIVKKSNRTTKEQYESVTELLQKIPRILKAKIHYVINHI